MMVDDDDDDDHIITNEALEIFKVNVDRLERAAEIEPIILWKKR